MPDEPKPELKGVAPYSLAMVICDTVFTDPTTSKRTILGCFSSIGAVQFPATHPAMAVYLAFTDGRGKVPMKLRVIDAEEAGPPLFQVDFVVEFGDPRVVVEVDCGMRALVFPLPGEYRIQLFGFDDLIIERRLVLQRIGNDTEAAP